MTNATSRRSDIALRFGAMMLLLWNLQASASTITWTGNHNSNWTSPSNWSTVSEPVTHSPGYDVVIPATITGTNHITSVIDQSGTFISLNSLTIDAGQATAFTVDNGSTLTLGSGAFTGSGTFAGVSVTSATSANASLAVSGALTNSTSVNAGARGVVTFNGAVANAGGVIDNIAGTINIGSSATVTGGTLLGTITNSGTISGATIGTGAGALSATINGGAISGATTGTHGTFNDVLFTGATLTNGGLTGSNTAAGANTLAGSISNSGSLTISSGTTTITGTIANTGTTAMDVSGGTLDIASSGAVDPLTSFTETAGVVTLSGTLDVSTANLVGGAFDGTGALLATTVNNGNGTNGTNSEGVELYVGGSFAAGNTAQTAGYSFSSYNQDSGGALGIAFNSNYSGLDQLDTSTEASLNGALDLYASNGTELSLSNLNKADSYVLIDDSGGLVNGSFSAVNVLGSLAGESSSSPGTAAGWWLVYNGSQAGGDGDVELDYVVAPTPELGTNVLLGGALVGLALLRRKLATR